jgi:hypothetical protein
MTLPTIITVFSNISECQLSDKVVVAPIADCLASIILITKQSNSDCLFGAFIYHSGNQPDESTAYTRLPVLEFTDLPFETLQALDYIYRVDYTYFHTK